MRKSKFAYALALAPLLLGAGGERANSLTQADFPICTGQNTYLAFQQKKLVCLPINSSTSTAPLPTCTGKLLTNTAGGELSNLGCIAPGTGSVSDADVALVTAIHDKLTKLGTIVDGIKANPGSAAPVFVGVTDVQPNAQIKRTGSETGLHAVTDLCNDKYAGSHMCTAYELYNSVAAGGFKMADATNKKLNKAWIWMPTWHEFIGTANGTGKGYADNCGSMSYPTHDKAWTGVQASWELLETGSAGFSFYHGDLAKCSATTSPIACCK